MAAHVAIVDVLRFSTAVDAAVAQGAFVYPYRWNDETAVRFAASMDAVVADGSDPAGPSLSPVRLSAMHPGDRVVLPSPNGSECAALGHELEATSVVAACLRNAQAVAKWLDHQPGSVAVIACGERWPDGSLRPALEDHLGAGALVSALAGAGHPRLRRPRPFGTVSRPTWSAWSGPRPRARSSRRGAGPTTWVTRAR